MAQFSPGGGSNKSLGKSKSLFWCRRRWILLWLCLLAVSFWTSSLFSSSSSPRNPIRTALADVEWSSSTNVTTVLTTKKKSNSAAIHQQDDDWANKPRRHEQQQKQQQQEQHQKGQEEERYLVYMTHSGFSNQIIGWHRAALLALATNRTLVLPPVLPHNNHELENKNENHDDDSNANNTSNQNNHNHTFSHWRAVGYQVSQRRVCARPDLHVPILQRQAMLASNSPAFPSLTELVDIATVERQVPGLRLLDFPQFLKLRRKEDNSNSNSNSNLTAHWSFGRDPKLDYTGVLCSSSPKDQNRRLVSYQHLVQRFSQNFDNNRATVAAIGSGFRLKADPLYQQQYEQGPDTATPTAVNQDPAALSSSSFVTMRAFPPSHQLTCLVSYLRYKLPAHYLGLHVRIETPLRPNACHESKDFGRALKQLRRYRQQLVAWTMGEANNNSNNATTTMKKGNHNVTVFLGFSNQHIQTCFDKLTAAQQQQRHDDDNHHRPKNTNYHSVLLPQLWDDTAQALRDQIHVQTSTINLVLDQFLLSLANFVTLKAAFQSTFHEMVLVRRQALKQELRRNSNDYNMTLYSTSSRSTWVWDEKACLSHPRV